MLAEPYMAGLHPVFTVFGWLVLVAGAGFL